MDIIKVGKQIALLRKECGFTQENLAEILNVSTQAVSKWENGRALPETGLLPLLASALNTSVDNILIHYRIQVLSAFYGDGIENYNVTNRLNKFIQNDTLDIEVNSISLACPVNNSRPKYLILKFQTENGIAFCFAKDKEHLLINLQTKGYSVTQKIEIIDAIYGTQTKHYNVMNKIEHYKCFNWNEYPANHEIFPSDPSSDEKDYLTFIYLNGSGIHFITCEEGESIAYTLDKNEFYRKQNDGEYYISNVPFMPEFGNGQECSWGAALTAALQSMQIQTNYEEVMGVSGACYRLAFCSPEWDYSSVDGLVAYDYATPAYRAFGYTADFTTRVDKEERSEIRKKIVKDIRSNVPVLGINLRVAPEWGVICGYKENGDSLFCRTKYDREILNSEEYEKRKQNPYDYLFVDNWPFIITFFGNKTVSLTKKENLINSMRIFVDCNMQERNVGYTLGRKAYETWNNDLVDETWYDNHNDEQLERRFSVNQFCVLALHDARRSAYVYLNENKDIMPNKSHEMDSIVKLFQNTVEKAQQIRSMLDFGENMEEVKIRELWTKELRDKQAVILMEMCELEQEALVIAAQVY